MYTGVCVCVCVCVAQGLRSPSSSLTLAFFPSDFPSAFYQPVHPVVNGYLAFAGVQIQGLFSCNSNGPGGTSGAHATCCEERPVLLLVSSSAPGALLAQLTVPA